MEIISYVGAASAGSASYNTGFSFSFPRFPVRKRARISFVPAGYTHPVIRLYKRLKYAGASFYRTLSVFALVASVVPVCVFTGLTYLNEHSGPARLMELPENELTVLNDAMSLFAMNEVTDDFDEDGNVLAVDGSILTVKSSGIGQVVSYKDYIVKNGDTISSISKKMGLTNISTLIAVNGIDNVRTLREGQKLVIPSQDGLIHTVVQGDSLNIISMKYHTSLEEILDANDLFSQTLTLGQKIFIPGARMDGDALKKAMGELFIYPIAGKWRLSSSFGKRNDPITGVKSSHTGIDMAAPQGTPVRSAMSGKVMYVGWSNIYGNYVIISHGNGYQTLYAHMTKALCHTGQTVGQGTRIGLVGSTGYSTGPHLHFTVYKNGRLVDPMTLIK